jgi:hypothetical protein
MSPVRLPPATTARRPDDGTRPLSQAPACVPILRTSASVRAEEGRRRHPNE